MHRIRHIAATLLIGFLGAASPAWAQGITCAMTQGEPSPSTVAAIAAAVQQHAPGLTGDDAAIKSARGALLGPLGCSSPATGAGFRVEYAKALVPVLTPLTGDARDQVAANALRIAGELATSSSLPLISTGLKDKRSSVRYAACFAAGRVFEAIRLSPPAVGQVEIETLLQDLSSFMAAESEPALLDGCVLALSAGVGVPGTQIKGYDVRSRSAIFLAEAVGAKARTLKGVSADGPTLPVLLRACTTIRNAVIDAVGASKSLSNPALISSGGLGGDLLALTARLLKGSNADAFDRQVVESIVRAAEATVNYCCQLLGVASPKSNLGEQLQRKRDQQYLTDVQSVIGENGVLVKPPFNLPKDRFNP